MSLRAHFAKQPLTRLGLLRREVRPPRNDILLIYAYPHYSPSICLS